MSFQIYDKKGELKNQVRNPLWHANNLGGLDTKNLLLSLGGIRYGNPGIVAGENTLVGTDIGNDLATGTLTGLIAVGNDILDGLYTGVNSDSVLIGRNMFTDGVADCRSSVVIRSNAAGLVFNPPADLSNAVVIGSDIATSATAAVNGAVLIGEGVGSTMDSANNTAIGSNALAASTLLTACVSVGRNSGQGLGVTGGSNASCAFFGTASGQTSDGLQNVFMGSSSGFNTVGDRNTGIGFNACRDVTGSDNVGLGVATLFNSGTPLVGSRNTAVGHSAGLNMVTADDCVIIGNDAGLAQLVDDVVLIGSACAPTATVGRLCFGANMEAAIAGAPTLGTAQHINIEWNGVPAQIIIAVAP